MHGVHSFSGAERLWWSALQTAEESLTDSVTADARAHSLFHTLDPEHRFRAGGLIGRDMQFIAHDMVDSGKANAVRKLRAAMDRVSRSTGPGGPTTTGPG
jgi:hypothetical protein